MGVEHKECREMNTQGQEAEPCLDGGGRDNRVIKQMSCVEEDGASEFLIC